MSFWIGHGTDGFRLDAVTSYYTGDPGRNIEFLRWLKQAGTELKQDCYFVCEAWTGMDEYASYYASGIDSMFDFAFGDSDGVIARTLKGIYTAREYGNTLERE
jgi:glycosidase